MQQFEVIIEKLAYGGEGLARKEGRVVLVPYVLPGELVEVEAGERDLRARLLGVREASAERVGPGCPYFGRCGGCHYQHATYSAQIEAKKAILAEAFRRIGKFEPPAEIGAISGEPWGYRNRAQFHLESGEIGYLEARSHRLCPVEICPISSPRINETLRILREMMRDNRWPRFVRTIELFTNETDVQVNVTAAERPVAQRFFDWCAERIPGAAAGTLDYPAGDFVYRVGNRSFFQVNRFLTDALVNEALATAAGARALDLYAGVGLFSLPLARRFGQVTAVESGIGAIRDLRFNAERAGLTVTAMEGRVETFLEKLGATPDFVLADPPRAGLGKDVVRELARLRPERITIVACDPATLARDVAGLLPAGYELDRVTLVDQFPQTFHLETVAHLQITKSL